MSKFEIKIDSVDKEGLRYKFIEYIGKKVVFLFGILIELLTGKIVFANPSKYEGMKELELNHEEILIELKIILGSKVIPGIDDFFTEQKKIASQNSWKSYPLFIYGHEFTDNTLLCPKTRELLLNVKGMSSAMFSILSANKTIPPHDGPYKGVLRAHLGLIIPENSGKQCYIEVDNQLKNWQKGKVMVFDDTHTHAAFNYTNQDRIVLFIDIVRPLPFPFYLLNEFFFHKIANSPFILETMEKYKKYGNSNFSQHSIKFHSE